MFPSLLRIVKTWSRYSTQPCDFVRQKPSPRKPKPTSCRKWLPKWVGKADRADRAVAWGAAVAWAVAARADEVRAVDQAAASRALEFAANGQSPARSMSWPAQPSGQSPTLSKSRLALATA